MKKYLLLLLLSLAFQIQSLRAFTADPPTVAFSYATTIMCMSSDNPLYGAYVYGTGNYLGGTFSCPQGGVAMSPTSGAILPLMSIPGTYEIVYPLPANGEDPEVVATTTITIVPPIVPVFAPIPPFCVGEPVPALPTVSTNGVPGTWSPAMISNQAPGVYTYTFIPDGVFCTQPYVMDITVVECTGMKLTTFFDANSNGIRDSGEVDFPMGKFAFQQNNTGPVTEVLAPTGSYTINDSNSANSYDIDFSIVPPYDTYYQTTMPSITDAFPSSPHMVYGFPVTALQSFEDLQVSMVPVSSPRPGFPYQNKIIYTNQGNVVVAAGTVAFVKDANVTITSVSQAGISNTTDGFTFGFTNLQPFESREILVTMQVPTIPTVNIGQTLTNSASIAYSDNTVNDTAELTQTIIGSYDPNDKTESHGPDIIWEDFTATDELEYTIRFENTGTANAENIRIVDVLDAKLNPGTIRFIASSHPCVIEKSGNQLTFVINNAQLPPSVANTNIGKGFVTFRIKPEPGFALFDFIPNSASIYFDFNPAIVTEEWVTNFVAPLSTQTFNGNVFVIYPNPASGELKIRGIQSNADVEIHDLLGEIVLREASVTDSVNIEKLRPGIYLVSITSGESKSVQKLIVK